MLKEYELSLIEIPDYQEISVVKIIHRLLGLSLKESRDLVKSAPTTLRVQVSRTTADMLQEEISQLGLIAGIREAQDTQAAETNQNHNAVELDDVTILNKYYSALARIDTIYQELMNVQDELQWYKDKLQEADQLATQHGVEKASNFPGGRIASITTIEKNQLNLNLNKARSMFTEALNLQTELEKARERLSKELENAIASLRKEILDSEGKIQKNNSIIESLKTAKMIEILFLVGGGVLVAILSKNLIVIIVSTIVILMIRSSMKNSITD